MGAKIAWKRPEFMKVLQAEIELVSQRHLSHRGIDQDLERRRIELSQRRLDRGVFLRRRRDDQCVVGRVGGDADAGCRRAATTRQRRRRRDACQRVALQLW